jgi:hypothetical protein
MPSAPMATTRIRNPRTGRPHGRFRVLAVGTTGDRADVVSAAVVHWLLRQTSASSGRSALRDLIISSSRAAPKPPLWRSGGGHGQLLGPGSNAGTAPSCWSRPSMSSSDQCSTTFPDASKRLMSISSKVACLPVGARPANWTSCVPVHLSRPWLCHPRRSGFQ